MATEVTVGDAWEAARRWWWLVALLVALAAGGTVAVEVAAVRPEYEARAVVVLAEVQGAERRGQDSLAGLRGPLPSLDEHRERLLGEPVLEAAARQLGGGYSADRLRGMVRARGQRGGNLLTVTVRAGTPAEARRVAEAVINGFTAALAEEQGRRLSIYEAALRARLGEVLRQQAEARVRAAAGAAPAAAADKDYQTRVEELRRRRADLLQAEAQAAALEGEVAALRKAGEPDTSAAVRDRLTRLAGKRAEVARLRVTVADLEKEVGDLAAKQLEEAQRVTAERVDLQAREAEARALEAAAADLTRQLVNLQVFLAAGGANRPATVVSPPLAGPSPVRPQPARDAAAAGVLAAGAAALLVSALEGARRSRHSVAAAGGAEVAGSGGTRPAEV